MHWDFKITFVHSARLAQPRDRTHSLYQNKHYESLSCLPSSLSPSPSLFAFICALTWSQNFNEEMYQCCIIKQAVSSLYKTKKHRNKLSENSNETLSEKIRDLNLFTNDPDALIFICPLEQIYCSLNATDWYQGLRQA